MSAASFFSPSPLFSGTKLKARPRFMPLVLGKTVLALEKRVKHIFHLCEFLGIF